MILFVANCLCVASVILIILKKTYHYCIKKICKEFISNKPSPFILYYSATADLLISMSMYWWVIKMATLETALYDHCDENYPSELYAESCNSDHTNICIWRSTDGEYDGYCDVKISDNLMELSVVIYVLAGIHGFFQFCSTSMLVINVCCTTREYVPAPNVAS